MLKQLGIDFAVVVGIPVLITGMYYFAMGPEANSLLLSSDSQSIAETPGSDSSLGLRAQNLLGQLTSLHFDKSIFEDPIFWSLVDFTQPISTTTLGRDYPFTTPEDILNVLKRSGQSDQQASPVRTISTTTKDKKTNVNKK